MKREFFAGTLALAIAALATPALAQGQGGSKPDSTMENPSTKTGGANRDQTPKAGSVNTGTKSTTSGMSTSKTGAGTPQKAMDDKTKDKNSSGAGGGGGAR